MGLRPAYAAMKIASAGVPPVILSRLRGDRDTTCKKLAQRQASSRTGFPACRLFLLTGFCPSPAAVAGEGRVRVLFSAEVQSATAPLPQVLESR
jgi:hypothetical protein